MIEKGLYYANDEFASMIKSVGGTWNDTKRRPIVCLIKSSKNPNTYWAIPMGNCELTTKLCCVSGNSPLENMILL